MDASTALLLVGVGTAIAVGVARAVVRSRRKASIVAPTEPRLPEREPAARAHKRSGAGDLTCFRSGLSIRAGILYRTAGLGSQEWHEVEVSELWGEPRDGGSWLMAREVAYAEDGVGGLQRIAIDRIMVLKDTETREEVRDVPEIARWLRLMAGGLNARDDLELERFHEERRALTADRAIQFRRTLRPPVRAVVECVIEGELAIHDVQIEHLQTYAGRPVAFSGKATRRRSAQKRAWTGDRTFVLQAGAGWEGIYLVERLRLQDGAEPVKDVADWLVEQATPKSRK
jgi:hypothetical protein